MDEVKCQDCGKSYDVDPETRLCASCDQARRYDAASTRREQRLADEYRDGADR